ncbi:helix-turn-helix domain-containing protein [Dysgonomonas sp. 520]|uniref:helix-turn-helix domain-containing protein n=1 Tax=Dysgonomonas sp. 520 TaxID=2302931 RepID=UPI0013D409E1|nr:helix-turn-helix domain-containing protein [Dysgonomonas sp. 520]NDW09926.1 DNA-binding protein [Dysgonomonas sp. 520]
MERIIVTTPDELRCIIEDVIKNHYPKESKKEIPENLSLDDTLSFLKENGFPTSKAQIYKLTSLNKIPYGKYGNKLVFSKNEILEWAKKQVTDITGDASAILHVVRDANQRY